MADQPRRLCIVASDWLRSGELIAALRESLSPQEPLEIIMDRRRGGSRMESGLEDRRRQPLVDLALATNGFALVPASVDSKEDRTPVSLLLPEVPIEPLFPPDDEDLARLESIRSFQRRRSRRLSSKLGVAFRKGLQMIQNIAEPRQVLPILTKLRAVLVAVALATCVAFHKGLQMIQNIVEPRQVLPILTKLLVVLVGVTLATRDAFRKGLQMIHNIVARQELPIPAKLLAVLVGVTLATFALAAGQNLGKSLMGRISQGSPAAAPPAAQLPSAGQLAAQTGDASPLAQVPAVREKPAVVVTQPARAEIPAPIRPNSPPRAATAQDGSGQSRRSAASRPSPSAPPESKPVRPSLEASKATPPRSASSPRVELAREPVSLGWGQSYAVRLLNPAGQLMAGAEVWLVARMADGTVEKIPMGALPEPGIYRATVPGRSSPVDLRVRVRRGDKRVEVPVKPLRTRGAS
jgi:hypothetical protein